MRMEAGGWEIGEGRGGGKGLVEEAAGRRGREKGLGPTPMTVGILVLPLPLPAPSTPFFQPPFLAELVVIVLILHPLQPEPGKVLKYDVIICGIVGIKFNEVGVHRGICFRSS